MSKILNDYIEGLERDRIKLLTFKKFVEEELDLEREIGFKTEKIEFLENILRIIEE